MGFGSGPEPGPGEIPEDASVGGEPLGAMLLPEDEGFDVEVEGSGGGGGERREGRVKGVVEGVEVERAAEEGAGPGEGEEGEVGVVEARGEVGMAGDWRGRRWRRRGVAEVGGFGGGGAEARRESGGVVAGHWVVVVDW